MKIPQPIQKIWKNPWFKFGLRLGCTILLFFILFNSLDKSISLASLFHKLSNVDSGLLMIGVIVGLFCNVISCYQWQCLLAGEHIQIDLRRLINLYFVGIAFNHFLPTGMGGDVVKAYYAGKENENFSGSTSAVIMSRITGFVGMLFVALPTILICHPIFTSSIILLFLFSCLAVCAGLSVAMLIVTLLPKLAGKWSKIALTKTVVRAGETIRESCTRPRFIGQAVFFGAIFHLCAALNYYCYAKMLHIPADINFYLVAIPLASLIAFLPISLNGYGLREGTLVAIFATLHTSASTTLAVALLVDIQVLLFGVLGSLIYILMGQRLFKTQPDQHKLSQHQTYTTTHQLYQSNTRRQQP
jgi:glycosyltransferase 2 family protein